MARWGDMPAWQRDQIAAMGREYWGMSRRQAAGRINRGTWDPYSYDPGRTIPRDRWGRPLPREDINRARALARLQGLFGDRLRWNPARQEERLRQASADQIARILAADDDELLLTVMRRPEPGDWFWMPGDINVLWYG